MYPIMREIEKAGMSGKIARFCFGSYYDGADHDFEYPAIVIELSRNMNGAELSKKLASVERIEKKCHVSVYDKRLGHDSWYLIIMKNDDIESGRRGYGECVAFQDGFWMKWHENRNASDDELIQAGHDSMIKHGYSVRVA